MGSKKLAKLAKITINVGAGFLYAAAGLLYFAKSKEGALACMVIGLLWIAFGTGVVWADSIIFPRTKPSLLKRFLRRLVESEGDKGK